MIGTKNERVEWLGAVLRIAITMHFFVSNHYFFCEAAVSITVDHDVCARGYPIIDRWRNIRRSVGEYVVQREEVENAMIITSRAAISSWLVWNQTETFLSLALFVFT